MRDRWLESAARRRGPGVRMLCVLQDPRRGKAAVSAAHVEAAQGLL